MFDPRRSALGAVFLALAILGCGSSTTPDMAAANDLAMAVAGDAAQMPGQCPATPQCVMECPQGGCTSCVTGGTCDPACAGGGCTQMCLGNATCNFACAGGKCKQSCRDGATCIFSCAGGGCVQVCATSSTCMKSCSGANCT